MSIFRALVNESAPGILMGRMVGAILFTEHSPDAEVQPVGRKVLVGTASAPSLSSHIIIDMNGIQVSSMRMRSLSISH